MQQRFEQLVDGNGGRLLQLARLILRSSSDAEDIVQETLIKLWNHLPALTPGSEAAWLTTCARNACLDRLRARQRQSGVLKEASSIDRELDRHIDRHGPAANTVQQQEHARLHAAIRALPEPGRSLIILRDIQDQDVAAVAEALDLTPNQVKVYTFRARRALRRQLEEYRHEQVA
jgi:RNA polymerase sigma-70 factor (ECF subfamily)